jgi:hypothetical protein
VATQQEIINALNSTNARLRLMEQRNAEINANYVALRKAMDDAPRSITQEIDAIPGRRIYYFLGPESGGQLFTTALTGLRGNSMNFLVSQDGPFIQTHLPIVMWRPTAPDTTTNLGRWRPVYSWPLPDQVVDEDIIDISWELADAGSQRNFQNLPIPASFSRPDLLIPLSVPTLFNTNASIAFFPTYNAITFNSDVPPTQGELMVTLPGYRIVNM